MFKKKKKKIELTIYMLGFTHSSNLKLSKYHN